MNAILSLLSNGLEKQIAQKFGIEESQSKSVLSALVPALTKGVAGNAQSGALESLMGLIDDDHDDEQYVDAPDKIQSDDLTSRGDFILGSLLGNDDTKQGVIGDVAQSSGLDAATISKILPVVATLIMGSLTKEKKAGNDPMSGLLGGLAGFLDSDGDGSVMDDVAKKLVGNIFS